MSQPLPNAMNYPKTEHNESFKVQEQVSSSEVIRPFPDGTNSPPVGYPPRPPLTRIDSRNSFQIRPGFPNPQGVPIRPPGQQIRPPPPGTAFVQRPPGLPNRPPFQQPFPNNQGGIPNTQHQQLNQIRQGVPNIRPGGPFAPRGLGPGPRPPGLIQQKSESATDQKIERENFVRYQSMDSTEARNVASPNQIVNNADISNINMIRSNSAKSASNSLHSSNSNLNEEINRSLHRNGSVEEKHRVISNSQESLDRKSEHEYPSRPESRSSIKMDQIMEDTNKPKIFSRPPSANENIPQRPDSRNSVNYKPPSPNPNKDSSNEDNQIRAIKTPTPIIDTERIEAELPNKSSLQLKNLTKAKSPVRIEGDNDSGVDESTQGNDQSSNGDASSPRKSASKPSKRISSTTPSKNRSLSRESKSPSLKSPDSTATTPGTIEKKKLPMNKVHVGSAPSPNLKEVRSKIGSLQNSTYKPGGGNVKIENKKIERKNVTPRIEAKNEAYTPRGGDKKIISQKLQWNAKSKIGSLENANHKPISSGKKIETVKLDFKEKAKPKVGSKDNIKHIPGGGDIKNEEDIAEVRGPIDSKKIEFQVQSKIGSLDNVKHKPKGGDKKIFDDKDYLRQMSAISSENQSLSGSQMSKSADAIPRDCFSSLDYRPRYLETVKEEISIAESRPSSRLSRSQSARFRSASTSRPRWRY